MGEATLKVPADYVGSLHAAVVAEVDFWTRAAKQDLSEIREARGGPDEERRVAFREGDLGDHQRALGEAGVLVDQLPAPGSKIEAEVHARNSVLIGLTEEAVGVCVKDLVSEMDYAPLEVEPVRRKMEELDWWVSQYESFEAARSAENKAEASR